MFLGIILQNLDWAEITNHCFAPSEYRKQQLKTSRLSVIVFLVQENAHQYLEDRLATECALIQIELRILQSSLKSKTRALDLRHKALANPVNIFVGQQLLMDKVIKSVHVLLLEQGLQNFKQFLLDLGLVLLWFKVLWHAEVLEQNQYLLAGAEGTHVEVIVAGDSPLLHQRPVLLGALGPLGLLVQLVEYGLIIFI